MGVKNGRLGRARTRVDVRRGHGQKIVTRKVRDHPSYFLGVPVAVVVFLGTGIGRGISIVPIRLPISSLTARRSETASSGTTKIMDAWYPSDLIFSYCACGIAFLMLTSMPFNNSPSRVYAAKPNRMLVSYSPFWVGGILSSLPMIAKLIS